MTKKVIKKTIKMQQDVGIAEQQRVRKQDDHVKQLSLQPPYIFFSLYAYYGKDLVTLLIFLNVDNVNNTASSSYIVI